MNELYLYHHGVKGMKWGQRRYQNPDGSLTSDGRARLKKYKHKELGTLRKRYAKIDRNYGNSLDRLKTKYENTARIEGVSSKKSNKLLKRYKNNKLFFEKKKEVIRAEIDKVSKMNFDDISKERKARGKAYTVNALINVTGGIASATTGFGVVSAASRADVNTHIRLTNADIKSAHIRAAEKVGREIMDLKNSVRES